MMKNLMLTALAAAAVSALSGCCAMKCSKAKSCCMDKKMSGCPVAAEAAAMPK